LPVKNGGFSPCIFIQPAETLLAIERTLAIIKPDAVSRGITSADIGTTIKDPFVDYATVAKGFGVYGEGPISDPNALAPALKRAIAMVKSGQPALLDVAMDQR